MSARVALWAVIVSAVLAVSAESTVIQVPADQPTIQAGINAASGGDTVLVSPGTYHENIKILNKNVVLASQYILNGDEQFIASTVIDGSTPADPDTGSCVIIAYGQDSTTVLEGFTLTGGTGTAWQDLHDQLFYREGGGVLMDLCAPIIRNNRIVDNEATSTSGGMASAGGGGIRSGDSQPLIEGNSVENNRGRYGAGIVMFHSAGSIKKNIIIDNTGGQDYGGGGIWLAGDGITIIGNSVSGGGGQGGGINLFGGVTIARNNIIWGNTQSSGGQLAAGGLSEIVYNDVEGGFPGTGNINQDPLFADAEFNLSSDSPCIDTGDPDSPFDPDGTVADMGAVFFYHLDRPYVWMEASSLDDSQGNGNGQADGGETVQFLITLTNTSLNATGVMVTLGSSDPDITIINGTASFGNLPRNASFTNTETPFTFSVESESAAHRSTFQVSITASGGYTRSFTLEMIIGTSIILLIDDDVSDNFEDTYTAALETKGIFPTLWEVSVKGQPSVQAMQEYEAVIWQTGNDRQTSLTADEQAMMASFLDAAGHLVLAGSNIGYDLIENGSPADAMFYADYLRAEYISDAIVDDFLYGVQGDPITGQFTFFALNEDQTSPSVINPLPGAGTIMTYYSTGKTAAIKYDDGYKLVYFALGLNDIGTMGGGSNDQVRGTLLQNALNWFNYVPTKGDVNQDVSINILDVLTTVNIILGILQPSPSQESSADCNGDATVNILDALGIVNVVLGIGECNH